MLSEGGKRDRERARQEVHPRRNDRNSSQHPPVFAECRPRSVDWPLGPRMNRRGAGKSARAQVVPEFWQDRASDAKEGLSYDGTGASAGVGVTSDAGVIIGR